MRIWLATTALLVCLAAAGRLAVLAQTDVTGHWQGSISAPGAELGIIVELQKSQGGLAGTISIPDQGVKQAALGDVRLQGREIFFEMPGVAGTPTFKGTISPDGSSIEGSMTQANVPLPFKLRRLSEAEVAEAAKKAAQEAARKPESVWQGTLQADSTSLRLVVKVIRNEDGRLIGRMDSLDQGATDLPIPTITLTDTIMAFEMPAINGAFQGKLNKQKTEAKGEWSQMGTTLPLTLRKVEESRK